LQSGDIRDQVMKLCEIARNLMFLGHQISGERATQISEFYKFWVIIDHVANFGDDWPSDLGDLVAKKEN